MNIIYGLTLFEIDDGTVKTRGPSARDGRQKRFTVFVSDIPDLQASGTSGTRLLLVAVWLRLGQSKGTERYHDPAIIVDILTE